MKRSDGIIAHNMRVFYVVDTLRALWFITSIWVLFERQFLSLSQITLIESISLGFSMIMQLPTGAFADLFGRKTSMILGSMFYTLAMIFYSISVDFNGFLVYAFLFGFAEAFTDGAREALVYDTLKQEGSEDRYPVVASKLSMIFQVSLGVATLIGGVVGLYSYAWTIYLTGFSFFCAALISFFYREPDIDSEKFTIKNYIAKTVIGVGELFKNSYIRKISLFYILIGSITWICAMTMNMILLAELQFTSLEIGLSVATIRITNSIIVYRLIRSSSFFTRKRTFLSLPIILIFTFIPTVFISKWWALIPIFGAMLVSTARWNILSRYTNAEFESKNRATALSALSMIIGIIYVIVVGSSGYIMEHAGGVRIIYTMLGIITLFTAFPLGIHLAKHHGD